ncbi:MAG: hypothetical protein K0R63_504 [Rickettsiales bacterium]|jgi:predicted secreted protein|nr:hypothetical protein [Rickettsiales bacterium]
MSVVGFFVTLSMVWWIIFFMILPVGVRIAPDPDKGHASSAPENPSLLLKAAVTTLLAFALTGLFFYLMAHGYLDMLDFHEKSSQSVPEVGG